LQEGMIIVRCLGQSSQISDFGNAQFMHRLAEIIQRRGRNAVIAETKIDFIEIEFENLLFRISRLDSEREQSLPDLSLEGTFVRQQEVFRHLLGNGGSTLNPAFALDEDDESAGYAFRIDAIVRVEIFVFGRDESMFHQRWN